MQFPLALSICSLHDKRDFAGGDETFSVPAATSAFLGAPDAATMLAQLAATNPEEVLLISHKLYLLSCIHENSPHMEALWDSHSPLLLVNANIAAYKLYLFALRHLFTAVYVQISLFCYG